MPVAGPAIALGAAIGGAALGGAGGAVIALGGGILASALSRRSAKDQKSQTVSGHQINTRSSKSPLPVAYGQVRIGVNKTFYHLVNPYLHIICELCEGEINGILREDGTSVYIWPAEQLPSGNPPLVYLDDQLFTTYGDTVYIEYFSGSSTQDVCENLQTATAKWDQALRHTAYLYVRLKFDPDKFNSEPDITAVIQGTKIYNPVDGATAYTNNPALCAYDYITRSAQRGGIGIAADRVDAASLATAINYCAAKGWTCNMPITTNDPVADNLTLIFNNFRGDIIQSGNMFKIKFRDLNYEPVSMSLDENDVIQSSDGFSSMEIQQPDAMHRPNAIRAVHLSAEKKYKADDIIKSDATAIAAEGDYREQTIEVYGLSDPEHVQKMSNYWLERLRLNKTVTLTATSRALSLEPMDIVQLDHAMAGWDDKLLRVIGVQPRGDHTVALTLIEEHSTFYDDVYNLTAHDFDDTDLPGPLDPVASVMNVSHAEEVYYYRNRSFTRWVIDFDAPAAVDYPFWDYAEIWLKVGAAGTWRFMTRCDTNYQVDPVEEGETYYIKIRSVSVFGVKEDFDNCVTISTVILGVTGVPGNLTDLIAIATGDTVTIFATPLNEPDIEGYEIRLGDSWEGGIFISFNKNISLRINGVRPGTHKFWAAAKNNAGKYSASPTYAIVTVFMPPGYTQLPTYGSWSWDFTGGTHYNTEHTTYDGEDALKCSHTGNVLTGWWESAIYSLYAIEKVRIWGDFRTFFVSSQTTWNGVFPVSTAWQDIDPTGTLSWSDMFQPTTAAQMQAKLRYKKYWGDAWSEVTFFELICAEIEAQWVQVVIIIIDPALDSNLYVKELNMLAYEGPQ